MAARTRRICAFQGGAASAEIVFDDLTNVVSSLRVAVTSGTMSVILRNGGTTVWSRATSAPFDITVSLNISMPLNPQGTSRILGLSLSADWHS